MSVLPPGTPRRETLARRTAVIGIATAVAVVSGLIASGGTVPGWEQGVFHAVNDLPDALRPAMWVFQLAGLLLVPGIVAAVAAWFRRWRLAIALVLFIPIKLVVEKGIVKQLVERQRPATSICGLDETCGNFRDVPLEGLSFVSGHAVIAWGVAMLLWTTLPGRWRLVPVAVALLNAVARVYLGAHNPLDVVGGGAIGIAIGAALALALGLPDRPVAGETLRGRWRR